jgi:hypothetical protein
MRLKHAKWKVYIPRLFHIMNKDDPDRRVQFCEWFRYEVREDKGFMSETIFSDEATFKMNGTVNRHICVYWAQENPHIHMETVVKLPVLTVWFGLSYMGLIRPFFFE